MRKLFGLAVFLGICCLAFCSCTSATQATEKVANATAQIQFSAPDDADHGTASEALAILSGESGTWALALDSSKQTVFTIAPGTYTLQIVPPFYSDGTVCVTQGPTELDAQSGQTIDMNIELSYAQTPEEATSSCVAALQALAEVPASSASSIGDGGIAKLAEQIAEYALECSGADPVEVSSALVALQARATA